MPAERMRLRQEQAAPVLQILKVDLVTLRQHPGVLAQEPAGKAIDYTLRLWDRLSLYLGNGGALRSTTTGSKTGSGQPRSEKVLALRGR